MNIVLDASAILAVIWDEPGCDLVLDSIDGAVMSAVNYAEVLTKIADRGVEGKSANALLASLAVEIIVFDKAQAETVSQLRTQTRHLGLSLGDRACIALATSKGWPVLTADKVWAQLSISVEVKLVR